MSGPRVVIVGGGLAGIAAAVRLAQQRVLVTLVETRLRLGGRATSFVDPTTGQVLDNCQHVLLGCCTNLRDLYERLGVSDAITWQRTLYFADPQGGIDELTGDDLPAPLHMAWSLLEFRGLGLGDKLAIARAAMAMLRMGTNGRRALHRMSFADWLAQQRQTPRAVKQFWEPVSVGAVNETIARTAADYAIQVFQEGLLAHRQAYVMGLARVPLLELYAKAEKIITQAGGELMLSTSAEGFTFDASSRRITGLRIDQGRTLGGDWFIPAVPFDRLAKLCPPEMAAADARLVRLNELEVSPIIGIHLHYELPGTGAVMDLPNLMLTDGPLHWLFNKGISEDGDGRRVQHLHGVISAAHELVDCPAEEIARRVQAEVRRYFTAAERATLRHTRVIKEKRATFSARPGVDDLRPTAEPGAGGIDNLLLAGDWTQTGWPATMEGATRSGYRAAAALLRRLGHEVEPLVPDLPVEGIARLLRPRG